jgi:hypothetical protein
MFARQVVQPALARCARCVPAACEQQSRTSLVQCAKSRTPFSMRWDSGRSSRSSSRQRDACVAPTPPLPEPPKRRSAVAQRKMTIHTKMERRVRSLTLSATAHPLHAPCFTTDNSSVYVLLPCWQCWLEHVADANTRLARSLLMRGGRLRRQMRPWCFTVCALQTGA